MNEEKRDFYKEYKASVEKLHQALEEKDEAFERYCNDWKEET